jgi:hypothetical protein
MEIVMRVAHLALVFMAVVYALRTRWILKFEVERDRTPARGIERKGIWHAYATLAKPWHLPSTRRHWFRWLEFAVFHLAVAIAIAMTFLIPYAPRLISSPAVTHFLQATIALGALAGLSRLARRLVRPEMRVISSPDEIFSPILAFFLLTTFFLIYVPFSKISHYIYWPFIRFYLGKQLGHRGVYPPKAVPRHG